MKPKVGNRTQWTVIVGAIFTVINSVFPDLLTPEIQSALTQILLWIAALFFADKVQRKA